MARVEVTVEELEAGDFPPVCAKTGDTTAHYLEIDGRIVRPSARWLLLAGLLPYVVYRLWLARPVQARIPMNPAFLELQQRHRRPLRVLGAMGIAVGTIGIAIGPSRLALAVIAGGLLTTALSLTVLYSRLREEHVSFTRTGEGTVEVQGVHAKFRDALANGEPARTLTEIASPVPLSRPHHRHSGDRVIDRGASPAP